MKTLIIRVLSLCMLISILSPLNAQIETITGAVEMEARLLGRTGEIRNKTLRAIPNIAAKKKEHKSHFSGPDNFKGNSPMKQNNPNPLPIDGIDPLRQMANLLSVQVSVEPIINIDGISGIEADPISVPDTNGDVSPDHYVQTTNGGGSIFKVFDKEGNLLAGPINMNALWEDFNIQGFGDPVILWDQGAERWVFTEFGGFSDNVMLVAISETSDPLGDFFAYEFQSPSFPDYPKYGVWHDAYYITTNEGGDPDIPVYIIDREAMLNGEATADVQRVGVPKFAADDEFAFQVATPADWDGAATPPPPGSPHYVMRLYDDAWDASSSQDKLEVWEIDVDWDDANNTTVTGPIELFTEPFDATVCNNGSIFDCLEDPVGNSVSAIMQVLMHRVQYRNFGSYESMVLNHVVDVNGNSLAGIRWYELRKPSGGQWEIYQQGTVSPDDNHRWLGSIAMDGAGNIGLGYTIMGPDNMYDMAFTGRRSSDPLGVMTVDEYIVVEGQSLNPSIRWGDYAMMSVDEADARTFWFTGEYMKTEGEWGTRIFSFILKRDTIDVGPLTLLTPQSSAYLTNAETVEVQIKNFGLDPQVNFDVGLIVDDVFIESKSITEVLEPDSVRNITFDTPIDLSVIGDYEFKIFTNLLDDENILNDTLREVVSQLPRFDLAITDFINIPETVCGSSREIGIVLTNIGAETITTANVDWTLNAGPVNTINWTGSLVQEASDTIYVTLDPLVQGTNTVNATSSIPNGMADEEPGNDFLEREFQAVIEGSFVQLYLLTDNYPSETTWTLQDEMGTIIHEGGPYTSGQTEYIEQWCLADGCYTFTIFDSYGDGIEYGGVSGDYQITDENGIVLAALQVASFGFEESNEFCSPFMCTIDGTANTMQESAPGANDGTIIINASNGTAPFEYSIDGGANFENNPIFNNLPGGTYQIVISDANGCTAEFEVSVATCTISFSAVVTDEIVGEMNGSIEITAENGTPPFQYSIDNGINFQSSNIFENLTTGDYSVVVLDANGCETTMMVNVGSMVSVHESVFGNSIEVLPNPTEGMFRINVTGITDVSTINVEMIDASGKVIQRKRLIQYGDVMTGYLSLRNYPSGIYFVRFDHKELQRMVKIARM